LDQESLFQTYSDSPIGWLKISATNIGITSIQFVDDEPTDPVEEHSILDVCVEQLRQYFQAQREVFDVPLVIPGTDFQQQVLYVVADIPFGMTTTYMEIARKINNEGAVRAVGMANRTNAIPIIIPCHRVLGANGKLTGYAGGLWRKQWLLEHEGALLNFGI